MILLSSSPLSPVSSSAAVVKRTNEVLLMNVRSNRGKRNNQSVTTDRITFTTTTTTKTINNNSNNKTRHLLIRTRSSSSPPPPPTRITATINDNNNQNNDIALYKFYEDRERVLILMLWLTLIFIATFVAPKTVGDFDMELIKELITHPFSNDNSISNKLFEALFNSLGVIPAVYASLLFPWARKQPKYLQPKWFCGLSFALGFFALGPYLILRTPPLTDDDDDDSNRSNNRLTRKSDLGFFTRTILESKVNAMFLTIFSLFLYYWAISHAFDSGVFKEFVQLLTEKSTLACVSTCDLIVLSICMKSAMTEDFSRRRTEKEEEKDLNAIFYLIPVLGPSLYLLTRPSLPE